MAALALTACGHYGFAPANDGGGGDGAGNAGDASIGDGADASDAQLLVGLEVWFPCDDILTGGTLPDESGTGAHGNCVTGECPIILADGSAPSAGYCRFDGQNDVVSVPSQSRFEPAMFTVAIWLRLEGPIDQVDYYAGAWVKHLGDRETWAIYGHDTSGAQTNVILAGGDSNYPQSASDFEQVGTLTSNVWYHVAVSYDGTTYRMYRDGIERASKVATVVSGPSPLYFGAEHPQTFPRSFWEGSLDDARFYSRVLSPTEIQLLATRQ